VVIPAGRFSKCCMSAPRSLIGWMDVDELFRYAGYMQGIDEAQYMHMAALQL
jgi:hypothetical protein